MLLEINMRSVSRDELRDHDRAMNQAYGPRQIFCLLAGTQRNCLGVDTPLGRRAGGVQGVHCVYAFQGDVGLRASSE